MPIVVSRVAPAGHAASGRPRMTLRSFASKADSYDSFVACVSLLPELPAAPVDASVVLSSALAGPEKRIDPEDRKLRSFADFVNACKNTYSMAEIEAYWNAMKLYK